MKKLFGIFIVSILILSACNKPEVIDYEKLIKATWACDYIDNVPVFTNDIFVLSFSETGSLLHAAEHPNSDSTQQWIEENDYSYTLKDNVVFINGTNSEQKSVEIEIVINSMTEKTFSFYFQKKIINGVSESDKSLYTLSNMDKISVSSIQDVWSGGEVSPITQIYDIYYDFKSDGSYDYYYFDTDLAKYVLKENNNGHYFFYKGYLALNWAENSTTINSEIYFISQLNTYNLGLIQREANGTMITSSFFRSELPAIE